jgi:hypothetical protein
MSERQPYTYVLLRYRHDPLAGEFANVGVLLHASETRFLGVKIRETAGPRLARMFPGMSRRAFREALQSIKRSVDSISSGGLLSSLGDASNYARRALPTDDSSFVWAPLGSGLTADPQLTLEKLYARFVAKYDGHDGYSSRDDAAVWQPVHNLLIAREIADRLKPKAISSPTFHVEFDHAWKNGAWHVYQPLSFDLTTDEHIRDKAAKWAGYLLGLKEADEAFKTYFVVGAPRNESLLDAYRRALGVLRLPEVDSEIVDESAVEGLVDRIEADVLAHDAALVD